MSSEESLWYRLGYLLEKAGKAPPKKRGGKLRALKERAGARLRRSEDARSPGLLSADDLMSSGAVALAAKLLDLWRPSHEAGATRLARAGVAGATAALLVELARPILEGRAELPKLGSDTAERLFGGAAQGFLYGAVVEPRVPGPPVMKGALYGLAEYAMRPAGGLGRLLGAHAFLGRLPIVGRILEDAEAHDRDYVEHVAFGIALALLYGSNPSNNGIRDEDEE